MGVDPRIVELLDYQDIDRAYTQAKIQLEHIPVEIKDLEGKIKGVHEETKGKRDELKALEVERSLIDTELKACEERVVKYKTQQMQVKKNEEYAAFDAQVEGERKKISDLEDKEIGLLDAIEVKAAEVAKKEVEDRARVGELEGQIVHLREQVVEAGGRIEKLEKELREKEEGVDKEFLAKYKQLKGFIKRGSCVVPLVNNRCDGCHITVSNDIASGVRKGEGVCQCDSCSRILYWQD